MEVAAKGQGAQGRQQLVGRVWVRNDNWPLNDLQARRQAMEERSVLPILADTSIP